MLPIDVATEHSLEFITQQTDISGLRILEVGCGEGHLALALEENGADVLALDERSDCVDAVREKGVAAVQSDWIKYQDDDTFDIILFGRSLHHIRPLEQAVRNAHMLLRPSGYVIIEDFAADRASEGAIDWLQTTHAKMPATLKAEKESMYTFPRTLKDWNKHHFEKHAVATSVELLAAIHDTFHGISETACAYLYRYLINEVTANQQASAYVAEALRDETSLIGANKISPVGLRIVARK